MLEVNVYGYNNPTGRCQSCTSQMAPDVMGCCDLHNTIECSSGLLCNSYFYYYCLRALGSELEGSDALRTGRGKNCHHFRCISGADISTCKWHKDKVKVSTKTSGLVVSKNIGHAHPMTSHTLCWLPKLLHYGALPSLRRLTSTHFQRALSTSKHSI